MLLMDVDHGEGLSHGERYRSRSTSNSQGAGGTRHDVAALGEAWSDPWRPLAGPALLERLRVTGRPRPKADPEFVHRIRHHLDEELSTDLAGDSSGRHHIPSETDEGSAGAEERGQAISRLPPLVVTKGRLNRVLACDAHHPDAGFGERAPTTAMACGAIVDVLFRQLVCVGAIGDPMVDGLAALAVDDRQTGLASWIERLPASDREELRAEVERQAEGLRHRWPALEGSWLPRTQESMRVQLAAGSIELSARVDLVIGRPAEDEASVAIVEVKSGARRAEHRADLHFYALVEALRSCAPPFVVATYYTRTGELDVDPVTEELLVGAASRTLIGARVLRDLADGADPRRVPDGLCGLCAVMPERGPGRAHVEGSGGQDVTR